MKIVGQVQNKTAIWSLMYFSPLSPPSFQAPKSDHFSKHPPNNRTWAKEYILNLPMQLDAKLLPALASCINQIGATKGTSKTKTSERHYLAAQQ